LVTACNQQQVCSCAPSEVFKLRQPAHKRWEQAETRAGCSALCEICVFDPVVDANRGVRRFFAHRDLRVQELKRLFGRFNRDPHVRWPNPESAQSEACRAYPLGVPDAVVNVKQNGQPVPGFFPILLLKSSTSAMNDLGFFSKDRCASSRYRRAKIGLKLLPCGRPPTCS
jgi:hypothetical protein